MNPTQGPFFFSSLLCLSHPLVPPHRALFCSWPSGFAILWSSLAYSFFLMYFSVLMNGDDVTSPWKQMLIPQLLSNMLQNDVSHTLAS